MAPARTVPRSVTGYISVFRQRAKMATTPSTLKKEKKDESFLEKIGGTLARKKKAKEG